MAKISINLVEPVNKAIAAVTTEMTAGLRAAAKKDQWQKSDIKDLKVKTAPAKVSGKAHLDKFIAEHNDTHTTFLSEYGDQKTTGRNTVRRFMNDSDTWMKRTASLIEKKTFGGK